MMTHDNDATPAGHATLSALFDSPSGARRAVERLVDAGISAGRIHQVPGRPDPVTGHAPTAEAPEEPGRGFWDSLGDFFFPDEDRHAHAGGSSRGGSLVTVTGVSGAEYDTALTILGDEGRIDPAGCGGI